MFDNSDPEMQGAYEKARATFRYFWREVAWERRRIKTSGKKIAANGRHQGRQAKPAKKTNKEHEPGQMKAAHLHALQAEYPQAFER